MGATAFQAMRRRQAEEKLKGEAEKLEGETPAEHDATEAFAETGASVITDATSTAVDPDVVEPTVEPETQPTPIAPPRPRRVRDRKPRTISG